MCIATVSKLEFGGKNKSYLSRNNLQNNSTLDKSYRNSENKEKEKKVEPQDHLSWLRQKELNFNLKSEGVNSNVKVVVFVARA